MDRPLHIVLTGLLNRPLHIVLTGLLNRPLRVDLDDRLERIASDVNLSFPIVI